MTAGEQRVDLVFQGGGVRGLGLAGAMLELDARGFAPQCVAGTSAGAIIASVVAAGYRGADLAAVIDGMRFSRFADRPHLAWLPGIGELYDVVHDEGLHSGDAFLEWITAVLAARGVHTFADLRDPAADPADARRRYRLRVIAADLTDEAMLVLPDDAERLGIAPDALRVADAVRMSMSIPLFFAPVVMTHPVTRHRHVIVDGGLVSNFPVWLFDAPVGTAPRFPTFGVMLEPPGDPDPMTTDPLPSEEADPGSGLAAYARALIGTAIDARDRFYLAERTRVRTIGIPTLGVGLTEFDITPARVRALLDSGRHAAAEFLNGWDFEKYRNHYR